MIKYPTNVVIGVCQKAGVDLHHSGIGTLFNIGKRGPLLNPLWPFGEFRSWRKNAEIKLSLMRCRTPFIPAHVEFARVAIDELTRGLMGRVTCTRSEVQEERFIDRDISQIVNKLNCTTGKIFCQVVPVLSRIRLFDKVIIGNEIRCVLIRFRTHESVETFKASTKRPTLARCSEVCFFARSKMPLPHCHCREAVVTKHFGDEAGVFVDAAIKAREASGVIGDATHTGGVLIATGEQTSSRRRAHRRGVKTPVAQTF